MIDANEVVELYALGVFSGIMLSFLPLAVGLIINLAFKTMKGG